MMKEKLKLFCNRCHRKTNHSVVTEVVRWWPDLEDVKDDPIYKEYGHFEPNDYHYQIIQCDGCEDLTFRYFVDQSNIIYSDWKTEELHPKRNKDTRVIKSTLNVPTHIQYIYREVVDGYNNRLYYLCTAGLRGLIEAICVDKGIIDGPLYEKIDTLGKRQLLSEASAKVLHNNRLLGNDALHKGKALRAEDLSILIDLVESILFDIYNIPTLGSFYQEVRKHRDN